MIVMAGVMAVVGCSQQETTEPLLPGGSPAARSNVPVTLRQSVVNTRAAQDLNVGFITTGEDILVKITDSESETLDYLYTAGEDGALAAKSGTVEAFYPQQGNVDIAAWYPATATADFAVLSDQREDDDYKASDLMFAKATDKNRHSGEVDLAFRHQMAKLKVNVTVGDDLSEVTGIRLLDVQRAVSADMLSGTVSTVTTDDAHPTGDIRISNNGAVLFPPQTLDDMFLEVTTAEGTALFLLDTPKTFEGGKEYALNITMTNKNIGAAGLITDWNQNGTITVHVGRDLYELVIADISDATYTGSEIRPTPAVYYNARLLTLGTDYELNYVDNVNAGTATVVATGKMGTACSGRAGAKTFTIQKATPVVTAPTPKSLTYNTDAQTLANAGTTTGGTLKYSLTKDGTYTETIPTGINAGSYTVWYRVDGGDNFIDAAPQSIAATIDKATPAITAPNTVTGQFFTGSKHQLITAGSTTATCQMQYSLDQQSWTTDATTIEAINAGTHKVYYRIIGNSNYNDVAARYVETTISKATPVIVMETGIVKVFIGNTATRTVSRVFVDNNGNGTWESGTDYDITSAAAVRYSSSSTAQATVDNITGVVTPVAVGKTTITATVTEDTNWNQQTKTYRVYVLNHPASNLTPYSDPNDSEWH